MTGYLGDRQLPGDVAQVQIHHVKVRGSGEKVLTLLLDVPVDEATYHSLVNLLRSPQQ